MQLKYVLIFITAAISATLLPRQSAHAEELCQVVNGAIIIAQDDKSTFLGKVVSSYDSKSIFNDYGNFGSSYNTDSIWNDYSQFGSPMGSYSPNNPYSTSPPMLIKGGKVIGYLTTNKFIKPSVSPLLLKALCKDEL